jgi:hypothetical protein
MDQRDRLVGTPALVQERAEQMQGWRIAWLDRQHVAIQPFRFGAMAGLMRAINWFDGRSANFTFPRTDQAFKT